MSMHPTQLRLALSFGHPIRVVYRHHRPSSVATGRVLDVSDDGSEISVRMDDGEIIRCKRHSFERCAR